MSKLNKNEILTIDKDKSKIQYIGIYNVLDNICDRIKATPHLTELEKLVGLYIKVYELLLRGEDNENR